VQSWLSSGGPHGHGRASAIFADVLADDATTTARKNESEKRTKGEESKKTHKGEESQGKE
jgi:hypothetical protein